MSGLTLGDPDDGPLGQVVADQPGYLGRADTFVSCALDGLAELLACAVGGSLGSPVGLPVSAQLVPHIVHAVMMPRPDG